MLGTLTSAIALATVAIPTGLSEAQENAQDPAVIALMRAMERRLTVWRSDTRVVYAPHCQHARGGCPGRLTSFARLIGEASRRHSIDPFLLAAVAMRESGFNPQAAGAMGERGIVQLHPRGSGANIRFVRSESYRRYCERQPGVCQEEVLDVGAGLLSRSIGRCGSVREGLSAYNTGACGQTTYARRVMEERQTLLRLAKTSDEAVVN